MSRSSAILSLIATASLFLVAPAHGIEHRMWGGNPQLGPYGLEPRQATLQCLTDAGAIPWPADSRSTMQVLDVGTRGGSTTVRLRQRHADLPVLGSHAAVRLDSRGRATLVNATLFDSLAVDVRPAVSPDQAAAAALRELAAPPHAQVSEPELAVLPDADAGALVYDVRVFCEAPLLSARALVDASSGRVLRVQDRVVEAWAWAYETSPVHGDPVEIELAGLAPEATVLDGEFASARSITAGNSLSSAEHLAVADGLGDFLFDPEEPAVDDPFAEVNAYHHVTRGIRYFEEQHGHELGAPIAIYTNFFISQPYDCPNAYYAQNPQGVDLLIYGQGDVDFSYDGDVVLHEFGHLINHDLAPLEMDYFFYDDHGWFVGPSAIDEGLADYWSATLQDSSTHSEYASGSLGLDRELDNDRTCPDDAKGESHYDGQIVSGAAWELRDVVGADIADALLYDALAVQGGRPTLADLAGAVVAIARELGEAGDLSAEQVDDVEAVLADRGMLDCDRAVPLHDGQTTELYLGLFYWLYGLGWKNECRTLQDTDTRFGAYFQLSVTTPPADAGELLSVRLDLVAEAEDGDAIDDLDLDYTVHLRRDEMVTFDMVQTANTALFPYSGSGPMPSALEYDLELDGSPGAIELTPDGDLALEPDTTYYLSVSHMNCEDIRLAVTPSFTFESVDEDEGDDDEGGCQCRQGPRHVGAAHVVGLGFLLAAAVLRRSRLPR